MILRVLELLHNNSTKSEFKQVNLIRCRQKQFHLMAPPWSNSLVLNLNTIFSRLQVALFFHTLASPATYVRSDLLMFFFLFMAQFLTDALNVRAYWHEPKSKQTIYQRALRLLTAMCCFSTATPHPPQQTFTQRQLRKT